MKAIVLEEFGGPEVLRLIQRERPSPDAGEALVQVAASGVCYHDLLDRGLGHTAGPTTGLEPARTEAGHLERKASTDTFFPTHDLRVGDKPLIEGQGERVHAAIPGRAVGLAGQGAACRLRCGEVVAEEAGLVDDE